MKKLLLGFIFLLISVIGYSQYQQTQQQPYVPNTNSIPTVNVTRNQVQNGWALTGNSCYGCASYWVKVIRSQQMIRAENGMYYYYFFVQFYSNSRYSNGSNASTYISQLSLYADGNYITQIPYIIIPVGQTINGAWLRVNNPNAFVSFTIAQMNVY